eukprot:4688938-Pyramimonas_sp.AAC.1
MPRLAVNWPDARSRSNIACTLSSSGRVSRTGAEPGTPSGFHSLVPGRDEAAAAATHGTCASCLAFKRKKTHQFRCGPIPISSRCGWSRPHTVRARRVERSNKRERTSYDFPRRIFNDLTHRVRSRQCQSGDKAAFSAVCVLSCGPIPIRSRCWPRPHILMLVDSRWTRPDSDNNSFSM